MRRTKYTYGDTEHFPIMRGSKAFAVCDPRKRLLPNSTKNGIRSCCNPGCKVRLKAAKLDRKRISDESRDR